MNTRLFSRQVIVAAIMATAISLTMSPSLQAGFFRRIFRGNCQQQTYYVQPATPTAPATTAAGTPQYQSFSYEPGSTAAQAVAPVQQVAPQATGGSYYQGSMRYESGSSTPNLFRGDSKIRGLQRN